MFYIVAPFETENISRGISSRNLEILKSFQGKKALILSRFEHRDKKYNSRQQVVEFLSRFDTEILTIFLFCPPYFKNISLLRILSNLVFSIQLFLFLLLKVRPEDTVLVNSIPPEVVFFTSFARRLKRFKLILDIRDIWPDAILAKENGWLGKIFQSYCRVLYRIAFRTGVEHYFYVSKSFNVWAKSYGLNHNFSTFLPLGYDSNRWGAEVSDSTNSSMISPSEINFVYVGYLSEQFDLTPIINVVTRSSRNDFHLHIIGGGPYNNIYRKLSKDSSRVTFYGMVCPKDVVNILESKDVGILPVRSGGKAYMPNKLFDYIAACLPVVVFGSKDALDFAIDRKFGWGSCENNINTCDEILNSITRDAIVDKSASVRIIRSEFSMENLYRSINNIIEK